MRKTIVNIMNILLTALFVSFVIFAICGKIKTQPTNTLQAQIAITVDIPGQGTILGTYGTTLWSKQTFMQFLGIPFAESPRGDLRFKLPVKRTPWPHILDATRYGRRCPVHTHLPQDAERELYEDLEDCLNLCIYSKDLNKKSPVMFYIYGGGFYNGSNVDHPPQYLLEKDVVLVVPNYRVGALGWLSLNNENMPGNAPLGDLFMALQWVQDYIHLFGGNPKSVTIFGQSAGAAMSGALQLSPKRSSHLFHRSIVQSGSIFAPWAITHKPTQRVRNICSLLKCAECINEDDIYACLRNASVSELLNVTKSESFGLTVGDHNGLLPAQPEELLKQLKQSMATPLMTGFTKHDGSFVLATYYDGWKKYLKNLSIVSVRQFAAGLLQMTNDSSGLSSNLLMKLLFPKDLWSTKLHKKALPAYFDLTNIIFMKSPVMTLANKMLQKHFAPVYLYSFDYEGANTRFGYEMGHDHYPFEGGVHHSNDNLYLFATHTLNEEDTRMAEKMVELWTSFAITGKPKVQELDILRMKDENGPYFHINVNITLGFNVHDELTATIDDPENDKLNRNHIEF